MFDALDIVTFAIYVFCFVFSMMSENWQAAIGWACAINWLLAYSWGCCR